MGIKGKSDLFLSLDEVRLLKMLAERRLGQLPFVWTEQVRDGWKLCHVCGEEFKAESVEEAWCLDRNGEPHLNFASKGTISHGRKHIDECGLMEFM